MTREERMERERKYLNMTEVAGRLEVSGQTVARMIERGELPSVRIGRRVKVPAASLAEYIRESRVPARA